MNRVIDRLGLKEPRRALALVVLAALVARLVALDVRVAHWDEARVGYWILHTADTGWWEYRPIIHGPFVQHVTRWTFAVAGVSDFTMRLPVALIGSALPATALLFRSRLRDVETIALGVILAANPLLLYYSRFMRSDLPLAAFAFVTLGAIVAAIDTDRRRYLHLAAIAFALALTTKENAVLYPVSWLGALTMLAVTAVVIAYRAGDDPLESVTRPGIAALRRFHSWRRTLLVLPGEMLVVLVFFYAPRSPESDAGLWSALADPALLPGVVWEATIGSAAAVVTWAAPDKRAHPDISSLGDLGPLLVSYAPFFAHFLAVIAVAAAATTIMALAGLRWRRRPIVTFCGWWALSGVVGYPYVADIKAPWLAVHVVVALAIPAAVGLVVVHDRLRQARLDGRDVATVGLAALLVTSGVFVVGSSAVVTYQQPPHGLNIVAQGGQPGGDVRPVLDNIQTVAGDDDIPDVLFYGDLAVDNESYNDRSGAAANWYYRLPLPWYTETANATVISAPDLESLPADPPPIVIANSTYRGDLEAELPGYSVRETAIVLRPQPVALRAFGFSYQLKGKTYVFFVDQEAVAGAVSDDG
ncbi:flippase activity-associated protein Agl23 [Halorhabdus tiamatea]|uniref:flippase activity-associated protein Agl23 n=1 Tax=Halorhabdus tiamatea TaxID=430914 RepID=UPI000676602C|nr:flippase activity-associated protein Agl23 [Halorhabdus tiamatea]